MIFLDTIDERAEAQAEVLGDLPDELQSQITDYYAEQAIARFEDPADFMTLSASVAPLLEGLAAAIREKADAKLLEQPTPTDGGLTAASAI